MHKFIPENYWEESPLYKNCVLKKKKKKENAKRMPYLF
jgi:hypothetical protein